MWCRAKLHELEQIFSFGHYNIIHHEVFKKNNGKISNTLTVGQIRKSAFAWKAVRFGELAVRFFGSPYVCYNLLVNSIALSFLSDLDLDF